MARITQYQSKAEIRPLNGSFKERTTPDKWLPTDWLNLGNPVAKAGALAVLAATTALAFVPVVSQAPPPETVTVDKWHQLTEQPSFTKRTQYLANGYFAPDRQQVPDFDSWAPQPNQPQFDQKRTPHLYPSHFGPDQQPKPRLDSWFQPTSEPVRLGPDKRVDWQGISALGVPPAEDVEEVTPERWQPNTNVPQFDVRRTQYLYPSFFAPERQPQPRLDSWFQPASEPVRTGLDKRVRWLGESDLQLTTGQFAERTTPDKWHPEISQPLFDRKRTQYTYEFTFFNPRPFASPIFAGTWHPAIEQPIFPRDRRVQIFGDSELQLASFRERTTPDKWHPAIEQPLFARARNQYLYPAFFGPERPATAIEVVTLDKWFQQASEPLRRRTTAPPPDLGFIRALESITPDKWFQLTSEPVRLPASRRHLLDLGVIGNGAQERVSPDKWAPLSNQPIFDLRRLQYLYPAYFGPDRQPVIGLDWFVQPNQPRFDTARLQYLDPPVGFAALRQPDVAVDTWWILGNQPIFDVARKQYLYPALFSSERQPDVPVTSWWQQPNQPIFDVARLQTLDPNLFRFDFPLPRLFNPGYVRSVLAENAIDVTTQGGQVKLALFQSDVALVLTRIATTTKTSEGAISITIEPLS